MARSPISRRRAILWNSSSVPECCFPSSRRPILGKEVGDKVSFTLEPKDGYGELIEEAIVDLPKNIFMIDGKLAEEMLFVGNQIPMSDNQGNRMLGNGPRSGRRTCQDGFQPPDGGQDPQLSM